MAWPLTASDGFLEHDLSAVCLPLQSAAVIQRNTGIIVPVICRIKLFENFKKNTDLKYKAKALSPSALWAKETCRCRAVITKVLPLPGFYNACL